ncbi:MAG: hypothetical protein LUF86_04410 [Clostridiales bacterium]|nr:hypothetical protein [Clostridiales bacterium]
METKMQVRDFHCKNCGTPLEIPRGSNGKVVCPSCKTECIIEGLVKNAEIQQKENINSGVPLSAEVTTLHNSVVNALTSSPSMPLDVLEQCEIVKEEHLCIPAYSFYCSGQANYTYEAGNIRQHKTAIDKGNYTKVEKENYLEWTQMTGNASCDRNMVASGNREFADIIPRLFGNFSEGSLEDFEYLEYPADVETYPFNLPQMSSFNEYCKPIIEKELKDKAAQALEGKTYRGLNVSNTSVHKDEMTRIFLGIYRITFVYKGTEYVMYISGDGKWYLCDKVPVDTERQKFLEEKERARDSISPPKIGTKLIVIAYIVGLIGCLFSPFAGIIIFAIAIVLTVFRVRQGSAYKVGREKIQQEINEFNAQAEQAKQRFITEDRPLKGIYSPY